MQGERAVPEPYQKQAGKLEKRFSSVGQLDKLFYKASGLSCAVLVGLISMPLMHILGTALHQLICIKILPRNMCIGVLSKREAAIMSAT